MYCKRCGNRIGDGDLFCGKCGAKTEQQFTPAFKRDLNAEIPEEPKRKIVHEEFNWNIEGYPEQDSQKTDEVDFKWESVTVGTAREKQKQAEDDDNRSLEERLFGSDYSPVLTGEPTKIVEKIAVDVEKKVSGHSEPAGFAAAAEDKGETAQPPKPEQEKPVEPVLEDVPRKIEKFYTFNKKKEEFQALLDQEYERLKKENEGFPADEKIMKAEPAPEPVQEEPEEPKPEPEENKAEAKDEQDYVCVALAETPLTVNEETREVRGSDVDNHYPPSVKEEKEVAPRKLTFDDVFNDDDDDDDYLETKFKKQKTAKDPEKKSKALKIVAVILCVLIGLELVMIGIQYFGKGTPLADKIDEGYMWIINLFGGDDSDDQDKVAREEPTTTELTGIISAHSSENKNIGGISEDIALVFENSKDYGFDNFDAAEKLANTAWYTADDGTKVTYYDGIVSSLIGYYSAWSDKMNGTNDDILDFVDDSAKFYSDTEALKGDDDIIYETISLKIGEIRTGTDGESYYVIASVETVSDSGNKRETETDAIQLKATDNKMKIVNIKKV